MTSPLTWRVYQQDWVITYTTAKVGSDGAAEAAKVFSERWEGRVEDGDYVIEAHDDGISFILLRLPQLQGEWRDRSMADDHAQRLTSSPHLRASVSDEWRPPGLPDVVGTGSAEERALLDYGKRKLRA